MKTRSVILLGILASVAISSVIAFIAFNILGRMNAEVMRMETLSEIVDKTRSLHNPDRILRPGALPERYPPNQPHPGVFGTSVENAALAGAARANPPGTPAKGP